MLSKRDEARGMRQTPLKRKTPLKAYRGLNPISPKRRQQLGEERIITQMLFTKQRGRCYDCGANKPDWRGWQKHEIIFRSHAGNPTDEDNCVVLCAKCHSARHGVTES